MRSIAGNLGAAVTPEPYGLFGAAIITAFQPSAGPLLQTCKTFWAALTRASTISNVQLLEVEFAIGRFPVENAFADGVRRSR